MVKIPIERVGVSEAVEVPVRLKNGSPSSHKRTHADYVAECAARIYDAMESTDLNALYDVFDTYSLGAVLAARSVVVPRVEGEIADGIYPLRLHI